MRSCKQLKNINSVSGKLGERHFDPKGPVSNVCCGQTGKRNSGSTNSRGISMAIATFNTVNDGLKPGAESEIE
jgi:hypothetical protein